MTLFETKKYYICDECRKSNPIAFKYENVKLENYNLLIISMLDNDYKFNINSYQREISASAKYFIARDYFFVYLDVFSLNDINIEILSFLADTVDNNILLLCSILKK